MAEQGQLQTGTLATNATRNTENQLEFNSRDDTNGKGRLPKQQKPLDKPRRSRSKSWFGTSHKLRWLRNEIKALYHALKKPSQPNRGDAVSESENVCLGFLLGI